MRLHRAQRVFLHAAGVVDVTVLGVYVFAGRLTPFQAGRKGLLRGALLTLLCDAALFAWSAGGATSYPPNTFSLHNSLLHVVGCLLLRMALMECNLPIALQPTPTVALGQLKVDELRSISRPMLPHPQRPTCSEHLDSDRGTRRRTGSMPPLLPDTIQPNYGMQELPPDENVGAAAAAPAGAPWLTAPVLTYESDGALLQFEYASEVTSSRASEPAEEPPFARARFFVFQQKKLPNRRSRRRIFGNAEPIH